MTRSSHSPTSRPWCWHQTSCSRTRPSGCTAWRPGGSWSRPTPRTDTSPSQSICGHTPASCSPLLCCQHSDGGSGSYFDSGNLNRKKLSQTSTKSLSSILTECRAKTVSYRPVPVTRARGGVSPGVGVSVGVSGVGRVSGHAEILPPGRGQGAASGVIA